MNDKLTGWRNAINEYAAATSAAGQAPYGSCLSSSGLVERPDSTNSVSPCNEAATPNERESPIQPAPAAPHAERRKGEKERRKVLDLQRATDLIGVLGEESRYGPADRRQAHSEFKNSESYCTYPDCRCPIDKTTICGKGLPEAPQPAGIVTQLPDGRMFRSFQSTDTAPQPSTAESFAAPSQEGVGQGGIAGADAELIIELKTAATFGRLDAIPKDSLAWRAAARIESLVRERDENRALYEAMHKDWNAAIQRAESAEARLEVYQTGGFKDADAVVDALLHERKLREEAEARVKFLESACDGFAEQTKKAQELAEARLREGK